MVNHAYRVVLAFLGASPIFLGFIFSKYSGIEKVSFGIIIWVGGCLFACFLFKKLLSRIKKGVGHITLTPRTVSRVRSGPTEYFLAYVMPIILGNQVTVEIMWTIFGILFCLCLFSGSEVNNPIVKLLGFRFYEVADSSGITYLLMSKKTVQEIFQVGQKNKKINVVQVDADFLIDFGDR